MAFTDNSTESSTPLESSTPFVNLPVHFDDATINAVNQAKAKTDCPEELFNKEVDPNLVNFFVKHMNSAKTQDRLAVISSLAFAFKVLFEVSVLPLEKLNQEQQFSFAFWCSSHFYAALGNASNPEAKLLTTLIKSIPLELSVDFSIDAYFNQFELENLKDIWAEVKATQVLFDDIDNKITALRSLNSKNISVQLLTQDWQDEVKTLNDGNKLFTRKQIANSIKERLKITFSSNSEISFFNFSLKREKELVESIQRQISPYLLTPQPVAYFKLT